MPAALAEPPSQVRVLHTDSEVHAAVERAVESDQFAQEALSRRIDRYKAHEPDPTGEVMPFPDRHGPAQPGPGQQHPA